MCEWCKEVVTRYEGILLCSSVLCVRKKNYRPLIVVRLKDIFVVRMILESANQESKEHCASMFEVKYLYPKSPQAGNSHSCSRQLIL